MAVNENVNKVVYGNSTLIDLTNDTVVPEALVDGYTAHDRSGATVTGTLELPSSSNPLPVEKGGTNANTASAARTNLDVYSKSEVTNAISQATANTWTTTTVATYSYGNLYVTKSSLYRICIARWSGNGTAPTATSVDASLSNGLIPVANQINIMRNGDSIEARNDGTIRLLFGSTPKTWSGGQVVYVAAQ